MGWAIFFLLLLAGLWAVTRFYLRGEDLSRYDAPLDTLKSASAEPSEHHHEVVRQLSEFANQSPAAGWRRRQRLRLMREMMDAMGKAVDLTGLEVRPADVDAVPGEWVLANGADPDRRLLYLHGGAFTMGSPLSHRAITTKLSKIAGAAVLAVAYRLMPEHRRLDCLTDCQTAYRWILHNGPQGPAPVRTLFVAGDSAGGNLTLAVIAWARDRGLPPAQAAVALSPGTDATLSGPSIRANVESDHMLGPPFGRLARLPRALLLWFSWLSNRVRPSDPRVSPVHGSLAGLPPTLVHASEAEMLLDDARRYVNKARAAGSEATLETWPHMLHVWHAFEQNLPEAKQAFEHIERFLERTAPRATQRAAES